MSSGSGPGGGLKFKLVQGPALGERRSGSSSNSNFQQQHAPMLHSSAVSQPPPLRSVEASPAFQGSTSGNVMQSSNPALLGSVSGNLMQAQTGTPISHALQGPGSLPMQSTLIHNVPPSHVVASTRSVAPPGPVNAVPAPAPQTQQGSVDENVTKCIKFFKTILTIKQNDQQEKSEDAHDKPSVVELVSGVIHGLIAPEDFTVGLQHALKSQAQPHLLPFLRKALPALRDSIQRGETHLQLDGVVINVRLMGTGESSGDQMGPSSIATSGPSPMSSTHTASPMPATPQQPQTPQTFPGPAIMTPQQPHVMQPKAEESEPMDVSDNKSYQGLASHESPMAAPAAPALCNQVATSEQQGGVQVAPVVPVEEEQVRTLTDDPFKAVFIQPGQMMTKITQRMNTACYVDEDLLTLISDAAEYRLRELITELGVMSQHRLDPNPKMNPDYFQLDDTKSQLKWLENLDRQVEGQRESREKAEILRLSKSKANVAKDTLERAKEMQRADAEAKRNRDANAAAIAALGGTKPKTNKWDSAAAGSTAGHSLRPKTIRANMRDLHAVLATEPRCRRMKLLHKLALATPPTDTSI